MNYEKNLAALKNLKKPKAVIFDWDNTLVDTWPLIHEAINETMRAMKKDEWSLTKVKDNIHKAMRDSFPEIFGDEWQKAGEIYVNTYRSINLDKLEFLPEALNLINKLHEKNIVQFVVSNKMGATLRREAKRLNVDDKFFALIGSTDAKADKPEVAPVELALNGSNLNLQNDEIWFVGDTIADVSCAYNANCTPIIYGLEGRVSKTIPQQVYENGQKGEGAIPLVFDYQNLIDVIDSF